MDWSSSSSWVFEASSSSTLTLTTFDFVKLARPRGVKLDFLDKLLDVLGVLDAKLAVEFDMFFFNEDPAATLSECSVFFNDWWAAMFDLYKRSNTDVLLKLFVCELRRVFWFVSRSERCGSTSVGEHLPSVSWSLDDDDEFVAERFEVDFFLNEFVLFLFEKINVMNFFVFFYMV